MANENKKWRLDNLEIKFNRYGDYEGAYTGTIKFQNEEREMFMFNMSPEMTGLYIELISGHIVDSASHLGERLLESLGLDKEQEGSTNADNTSK